MIKINKSLIKAEIERIQRIIKPAPPENDKEKLERMGVIKRG